MAGGGEGPVECYTSRTASSPSLAAGTIESLTVTSLVTDTAVTSSRNRIDSYFLEIYDHNVGENSACL